MSSKKGLRKIDFQAKNKEDIKKIAAKFHSKNNEKSTSASPQTSVAKTTVNCSGSTTVIQSKGVSKKTAGESANRNKLNHEAPKASTPALKKTSLEKHAVCDVRREKTGNSMNGDSKTSRNVGTKIAYDAQSRPKVTQEVNSSKNERDPVMTARHIYAKRNECAASKDTHPLIKQADKKSRTTRPLFHRDTKPSEPDKDIHQVKAAHIKVHPTRADADRSKVNLRATTRNHFDRGKEFSQPAKEVKISSTSAELSKPKLAESQRYSLKSKTSQNKASAKPIRPDHPSKKSMQSPSERKVGVIVAKIRENNQAEEPKVAKAANDADRLSDGSEQNKIETAKNVDTKENLSHSEQQNVANMESESKDLYENKASLEICKVWNSCKDIIQHPDNYISQGNEESTKRIDIEITNEAVEAHRELPKPCEDQNEDGNAEIDVHVLENCHEILSKIEELKEEVMNEEHLTPEEQAPSEIRESIAKYSGKLDYTVDSKSPREQQERIEHSGWTEEMGNQISEHSQSGDWIVVINEIADVIASETIVSNTATAQADSTHITDGSVGESSENLAAYETNDEMKFNADSRENTEPDMTADRMKAPTEDDVPSINEKKADDGVDVIVREIIDSNIKKSLENLHSCNIRFNAKELEDDAPESMEKSYVFEGDAKDSTVCERYCLDEEKFDYAGRSIESYVTDEKVAIEADTDEIPIKIEIDEPSQNFKAEERTQNLPSGKDNGSSGACYRTCYSEIADELTKWNVVEGSGDGIIANSETDVSSHNYGATNLNSNDELNTFSFNEVSDVLVESKEENKYDLFGNGKELGISEERCNLDSGECASDPVIPEKNYFESSEEAADMNRDVDISVDISGDGSVKAVYGRFDMYSEGEQDVVEWSNVKLPSSETKNSCLRDDENQEELNSDLKSWFDKKIDEEFSSDSASFDHTQNCTCISSKLEANETILSYCESDCNNSAFTL